MENTDTKDIKNRSVLRPGTILIASPLLNDPNFKRTVILILDKDANNGHIGLILNRNLDISMQEACDMPGKAGEMSLYHGGPVDLQRLFWLDSYGDRVKGSYEILPGINVGGDYDNLMDAISNTTDPQKNLRFYLGYSGWSAGQLEKEIEAGAWGIVDHILDPNLLLTLTGNEMWNAIAKWLGPAYRHWLLLPSDPNLN